MNYKHVPEYCGEFDCKGFESPVMGVALEASHTKICVNKFVESIPVSTSLSVMQTITRRDRLN